MASEELPVPGHVQHLHGGHQIGRYPGPRVEYLSWVRHPLQHHAGVETGYISDGFSDFLWMHSLQVPLFLYHGPYLWFDFFRFFLIKWADRGLVVKGRLNTDLFNVRSRIKLALYSSYTAAERPTAHLFKQRVSYNTDHILLFFNFDFKALHGSLNSGGEILGEENMLWQVVF